MTDKITTRPTPWTSVILVCGKCSRKLDGGFGAKRRETLRTALNDELRAVGERRRVRVMEAKCFGLCPKKAVVALNASAPGRFLLVPQGTEAGLALTQLGAAPARSVKDV